MRMRTVNVFFRPPIVVLLILSGAALLTAACSHKSAPPKTTETRLPASLPEGLTLVDVENMNSIISSMDSVHFQQKLLKVREAQTLVSAFDRRIASIKTEAQIDQLFQSKLYCKLMDVRAIHEHTEDQLIYGLTVAKAMGLRFEDWYFQQMSQFANSETAREAAMVQLFRGLVNNEITICGKEDCVSSDVTKLTGFHVKPLDNKDVRRFFKSNNKNIALSTTVGANDLAAGDCFTSATSSRKPQTAGFDWVNRNWVGSVLPVGQFVFTYDDGPHASFTRDIRDTWANAGMAKPAFFWLRKNATALAPIVKELNNQGYVIGSHSERHADLGNLAKADGPAAFNGVNKQMFGDEIKGLSAPSFAQWKAQILDREINQSAADLAQLLGKPVRYFRLPYGSGVRNDLIGARFESLNLDHFFWRVDSLDWQDKNPESIRDRVVAQMNVVKKGIVLFHDIHPQSAQAAKLMVQFFKENKSYKAVSISDIPGLKP